MKHHSDVLLNAAYSVQELSPGSGIRCIYVAHQPVKVLPYDNGAMAQFFQLGDLGFSTGRSRPQQMPIFGCGNMV